MTGLGFFLLLLSFYSSAPLVGDPHRVSQVLTNLLSNAAKFTERGTVTLKVTSHVDKKAGMADIVFAVSDTGIGIDQVRFDMTLT